MKLNLQMISMAAAIAMAAASAAAAANVAPSPPACTPEMGERPAPHDLKATEIGMAVLAGGGVTDFTSANMRNETGLGGSWNFRVAVATRYWIGFEASYVGGANPIRGLGLSNHSKLVRNGLEGSVRAQAPLRYQSTLLEPYIVGGVGWNSYRVTYIDSSTASVSSNNDNTISVPLGVGFMVVYKGFVADLRYTVRPTYQQTILAGQGEAGLTNWDLGAMIGFEF